MTGDLDTGVLYRDDNLTALQGLPEESVDLVYLDPPFFSNRHYEIIWGDEAEVRSFEDRWEGGLEVYINWIKERMVELRRILKPTGTIYLHCDWHAGHYLKVMMDEIFGARRFLNEIVWHYGTASGAPKKWLHRNHDTIFRYCKGPPREIVWNHPREPWPQQTLKKWQKDEEGRIYRVQNKFGKRYYIDPEGKLAGDVWNITLSSRTRERLGYPTQKPEALLERIVKASSNENDIVLDPFCGCGTTVAVAERLGRRWIGIDISATAVEVMRRRLLKQHCTPRIENAVQTVTDLKKLKPFEFQNWVINAIYGTHSPKRVGDMGIDGYWFFTKEPVQVKQSEHVGRNIVDNFETAIRRAGHTTGYLIAFSFTRGAAEEAARAKRDGLDIRLVRVAEVLLLVKRPHGKLGPQPGTVEELPLPPPRKPTEMPSAEELVKSEKIAG